MLDAAVARCLALSRQVRSLHGEAQMAALDQLEAALAALQAPQAQVELDLAGYLTGWDEGAARLFGYTAAEALGQHVLFLYSDDDAGEIAELDGVEQSSLVCRRARSGQLIWLRQRTTLRQDGHGEPVGISLSFSLSEQQHEPAAQALHARIVEDSAEGVLITDSGTRIVSVNAALCRISGYPAAELLGQDVAVLDAEAGEGGLLARLRAARACARPAPAAAGAAKSWAGARAAKPIRKRSPSAWRATGPGASVTATRCLPTSANTRMPKRACSAWPISTA